MDDAQTAIDTDDAPRRQPVPDSLPPLTAQQRAEGWHDGALGRVRRICQPASEEEASVLSDGDPWVWER